MSRFYHTMSGPMLQQMLDLTANAMRYDELNYPTWPANHHHGLLYIKQRISEAMSEFKATYGDKVAENICRSELARIAALCIRQMSSFDSDERRKFIDG